MGADITTELRELSNALGPGELIFSDQYRLEDALVSIEIGHPKMDRGMVCIEGLQLVDWVHAFFMSESPLNVNVLVLLQTLFRLEMTWYTGTAGTSDTLLSCVLMHRNPRVLAQRLGDCELAVLTVEATMAVATLVAMLTTASPAVRDEDFSPGLHGMNAWSPAAHHGSLDNVLFRLTVAASTHQGLPEHFYLVRLHRWIRALQVWRQLQVSQFTGAPEELAAQSVLQELQHVAMNEASQAEHATSQSQPLAFFDQRLANLFGLGCVRPARRILSFEEAKKVWNQLLCDDLGSFLNGLLETRPRLDELLRLLASRRRRPDAPALLPLSRALIHLSLVQTAPERDQQSFFCRLEARDVFLASSWPGVPILALPQLVAFCTDLVQVYCSNTSRQRRYLTHILPAYAQFLDSEAMACSVMAGTRAHSQLLALNATLQADWILLGFELELYTTAEENEADYWLAAVLGLSSEVTRRPRTPERPEGPARDQTEDNEQAKGIRWQHRWAPLLQTRTSPPTLDEVQQISAFRHFLHNSHFTGHDICQLQQRP